MWSLMSALLHPESGRSVVLHSSLTLKIGAQVHANVFGFPFDLLEHFFNQRWISGEWHLFSFAGIVDRG
jgi:hypothetical protein